MTTWNMPEPPPYEVFKVKDRDGREYERVETDGSLWRDAMWTLWDWDNLVYQRGPIETVDPPWNPEAGASAPDANRHASQTGGVTDA